MKADNIEDCGADCPCHTEGLVEIQDRVFTNTNGGAGMSDKMKELIKLKEEREKEK